MFAHTKQRSGSLERTGWRVAAAVWVAGLVAVLVGWLLAAPPASAGAFGDAQVYVQSAKSGELGGGRLTLRGVGRRVTWAAHPGRFGVVSVKRLHRQLFTPRTPSATGTLHVAGQRGGEELVLRLSRPRYNASRGTVSYRVRRLNMRTLPRRAARASRGFRAPRFGPASLSIVSAPQVSDGSLTIANQPLYVCPREVALGYCWGKLSGHGLQPGGTLFVNARTSDGGVSRRTYQVDQLGLFALQQLNLPCATNLPVFVSSVTIYGAGASAVTVNAPDGECPGPG